MTMCKQGWWSRIAWDEVQGTVQQHNSELANILDELSKSEAAPLLTRVRYPFGTEIISSGELKLPCDCDACARLIAHLTGRTSIPLGLVLNNRIEVLTKGKNTHQTEPLRLLCPGDMFGVFEIAERMRNQPVRPAWTLSAGARTVVPLWQFGNRALTAAIKKVLDDSEQDQVAVDTHASLDLLPSKNDGDRWHEHFWPVLNTLARRADPNWIVEVLFLDVDWSNLQTGQPLRAYIFETAWDQSRELRERAQATSQRETAVVSRIIRISRGEGIGFTPGLQNGELGPFGPLQNKLVGALLAGNRQGNGRVATALPKLPLLLLPTRMASVKRDAGVAYFSLNNRFTEPIVDARKFSHEWRQIAGDARKAARRLADRTQGSGVRLDFFSADTAIIDSDTKAFAIYKKDFFEYDFSEQLSLAKDAGWPASLAHDDVLTTKTEGFFVSFARIALPA